MSEIATLVWAHSLLALALKSTVILGLALIASWLLRKRSASVQHWTWLVALAACLVMPLAMTVLPRWLPPMEEIPDGDYVEELWTQPVMAIMQKDGGKQSSEASELQPPQANQSEAPMRGPWTNKADIAKGKTILAWMRAFVLVWGGVALCFLAWFFVGLLRSARLVRAGFHVVDPEWRKALAQANRQSGYKGSVRLLESESLTLPIAVGWLRPAIMLPSTRSWSAEERVQVLIHELAHLQRRDNLSQSIAFLSCAIFWFQPLAWVGYRRMLVLREHAADDAVLRAGTRAEDYGDSLVQIARRGRAKPLLPVSSIATRGGLAGRIGHLLSPATRLRLSPRGAAISALLATLAIAGVGSMGLNPSSAYALKAELESTRSYERPPLFSPSYQGNARGSYDEALRLAIPNKWTAQMGWSGSEQSWATWSEAPTKIREFGASEETREIAELIVRGASHGSSSSSGDYMSLELSLDFGQFRVRDAVTAASLHAAETGEPMRAVRYLLALGRFFDDQGRGGAMLGLLYSSGLGLPVLDLIRELSPQLTREEHGEMLRGLHQLNTSAPSLAEAMRTELLFGLWSSPVYSAAQIDEFTEAIEAASGPSEVWAALASCPSPGLYETSKRVLNGWLKRRSRALQVEVDLAGTNQGERLATP